MYFISSINIALRNKTKTFIWFYKCEHVRKLWINVNIMPSYCFLPAYLNKPQLPDGTGMDAYTRTGAYKTFM